jgi:hypothetical protein
VVAEQITDPAERAALDDHRQRARQRDDPLPAKDGIAVPPSCEALRLLDLSRQLPPEEWGALLTRVTAALSAEQQFELLAQVLAQLSPETLYPLEGELTARLGANSN